MTAAEHAELDALLPDATCAECFVARCVCPPDVEDDEEPAPESGPWADEGVEDVE